MLVAELGHHQLGGVGVDHLVDRRHDAHAHQRLDHVGAALGHAVGELLHRDGLGHDDVAHDLDRLLLRLQHALLLALAGAAHRGEAAHALAVVLVERLGDGELAGAAARLVAAGRCRRLLDVGAQAALAAASSSISASGLTLPAAVSAATLAAAALPARSAISRRDSSSVLRLVSSSVLRLASSSTLRLASSSTRRRPSSSARWRASSARRCSSSRSRVGVDHRLLARVLVGADGALERAHAAGAFLGGQAARQHHRAARRLRRAGVAAAAGVGGAVAGRRRARPARACPGDRRASCAPRPGPSWSGHAGSSAAPGRSRSACAARAGCRRATQAQRAFGVVIAVIGHRYSVPSLFPVAAAVPRPKTVPRPAGETRRAAPHLDEQLGEPSWPKRRMHHMLAPERRTQLDARQTLDQRQVRRARP